jgi:general secretion pathway protein G
VKQKEDNLKTLVTFAICLVLASPAFCQSTSAPKDQQEKEQQLRTALEQIRMAIDHYRGMADRGKFMVPVGSRNYPLDLETLAKGVVDAHGKTIKFLPKIPVDPMTGTTDWGLKRAPVPRVPGGVELPEGGGIFDVYTKSDATALDGTKYQDW